MVWPGGRTDESESTARRLRLLTARDESFKGTVVSRKSVGDLITRVIASPELHVGANLGVNKPNTDGDKPYFMQEPAHSYVIGFTHQAIRAIPRVSNISRAI